MDFGSRRWNDTISGMVEERDEKTRAGRRWAFYVALFLTILFLYATSLGPAGVIGDQVRLRKEDGSTVSVIISKL